MSTPGAHSHHVAPFVSVNNKMLLFAVVLVLGLPAPGAKAQDRDQGLERLSSAARVWGAIKYFHPALANRDDLDWDLAAIAAIRDLRSSTEEEDFKKALRNMIERLDDPLTRIDVAQVEAPAAAEAPVSASARLMDGGVLLLTLPDYYALSGEAARSAFARANEALPRAKAVVLDLRTARATGDFARAVLTGTLEPFERALISTELARPGSRRRVYSGYQGFSSFSSGQYRSGLFTESASPLRPASSQSADRPMVVLLNRNSVPPTSLASRQAMGRAKVVFEGRKEDAVFGDTMTVPVEGGGSVRVRVSEPVHPDGTSAALEPDMVVSDPAGVGMDPALAAALAAASEFTPSSIRPRALRSAAAIRPERSYADMKPPAVEYRILAAFRFWNVIRYFYPYHALLDDDWDAVLPSLIRDFAAATDEAAYARAVVSAARRLHDGHAYVAGGVFDRELAGEAYPPLRVRLVESKLVVTALYDENQARTAGVSIGDVVVEVEGENALARLTRYKDLFSASTAHGLNDRATLSFMNGPLDSKVALGLLKADGLKHQARLTRRREDFNSLYHRERSGEVLRLLPGNIGYVDLDRLPFDGVDAMFEKFRDTAGLVFDMRGYPNGTVWRIAPRLTDATPIAALFHTPMPGYPSPSEPAQAFTQRIEKRAPGLWRYNRPTVMLMDERSQSQAEHTGLLLKAANGTAFVGSATSGANGEITTISLPGGFTVGFTGQEVTWPDGRQLQRKGLLPDVEVCPTLRGIQAGRDEVLDAAIRNLRTKRSPLRP